MPTLVSIIIPCRDEEKYIGKCLDSIIAQDFPKEKIEILVVDGISEDGTRKILEEYSRKYSFIRILDNPQKTTPFALNTGIRNAKGEIIIRMDSHATYKEDYVSKCIRYLEEYNVDNVGGVMKTIPSEDTITAEAITISLSHPFGQGGSYFRTGVKNSKLVDTVFGGCYRKEVFKKLGFFNEKLIKSQDLEFNLRLNRADGKILLAPDIISYYYPKSDFKDFFIHKINDGIWPIYQFKFTKKLYCLRHYIPFLFSLALMGAIILAMFYPVFFSFFIVVIGIYLFFVLYFSLEIAFQKKEWRYFFLMPVAFFCRHFGQGLGSLYGVIKLIKS